MFLTDDLEIGQIVKSKSGRDKGRLFVIYEIVDDQYVRLVDGDLRKLDNPKLKKVKHLTKYNTVVAEIKEKIDSNIELNDSHIRRILKDYE